MLFTRFLSFFKVSVEKQNPLGRWGYHWNKTIKYNKYYD